MDEAAPELCLNTIHNTALPLIAGDFAQTIAQIWPTRLIGEYFAATNTRRHVWHACLAAESNAFHPARAGQSDIIRQRFTSGRSKDLILQAYGTQPAGALRALGLFGATARAPHIYRDLIAALENGGLAAKYLMHSKDLPDCLVSAMAAFPKVADPSHLLSALAHRRIDADDLLSLLWALNRIAARDGATASQRILMSAKPVRALMEHVMPNRFPAPPWSGREMLKPIATRAGLESIGKRFNNCLAMHHRLTSEAINVYQGQKYFYEWSGEEPALMEITSIYNVGWFVTSLRARNNAIVSFPERQRIEITLQNAECICAVNVGGDQAYRETDLWGIILHNL